MQLPTWSDISGATSRQEKLQAEVNDLRNSLQSQVDQWNEEDAGPVAVLEHDNRVIGSANRSGLPAYDFTVDAQNGDISDASSDNIDRLHDAHSSHPQISLSSDLTVVAQAVEGLNDLGDADRLLDQIQEDLNDGLQLGEYNRLSADIDRVRTKLDMTRDVLNINLAE
jgi:hypothetical protein